MFAFDLCLVSLFYPFFLSFFLLPSISLSLFLFGTCYVAEAGLEFFGMSEMKDTPSKKRANFALICNKRTSISTTMKHWTNS